MVYIIIWSFQFYKDALLVRLRNVTSKQPFLSRHKTNENKSEVSGSSSLIKYI